MAESTGVRAFFERLAVDDEFRASVVENPTQVMNDYDIEYDPQQVPDEVRLPSKDALARNLDDYIEKMGDEPVGFGVWFFIIDPTETS